MKRYRIDMSFRLHHQTDVLGRKNMTKAASTKDTGSP
jgi:hypothetical protein